jgi:hypothetical protein
MLLSGVFRVSVCPFPSICNLLSVPNCWGDATPPSIIRRNYRILSLSLLIVTLTPLAIVLISDTSPAIPTCHPLLHHMSSSAEQRHPPSPISLTLVAIWPPLTASRHLCPRCTCFCSTDSSSTGIFFQGLSLAPLASLLSSIDTPPFSSPPSPSTLVSFPYAFERRLSRFSVPLSLNLQSPIRSKLLGRCDAPIHHSSQLPYSLPISPYRHSNPIGHCTHQ